MTYDVVVVGAGHAGCEAASAAARMGRRTALVTFKLDHIAKLSCNPAIGGQAKGHLVRELDALGGIMARVADEACIQFRRLNTRRGLAVQSSRAQVDIHEYPGRMQARLKGTPNLDLIEGEIADLQTEGGRVSAVVLADGRILRTTAAILTTGTFLGAVMHRGMEQEIGGRIGDPAATQLSRSLTGLGLRLGRLKTGTPPRLASESIAWDRIETQTDTVPEGRFSFGSRGARLPQIDCHMVYTNEQTHEVIRGGLDRSPLFTGVIQGTGPRYCPSIEDKVVRFPERDRHLIFLEPEGLNTNRVYPNGLSTSLPLDVQERFLHSIEGLENAVIVQPGYAVEYDYADPCDLGVDLQHRSLPGLYFAGQVNGTSGYEEAAVQGFIAGVSAAQGEPFVVRRSEGYIGVLVDDLVSKGIGGEPYRMFTSRAEHRLLLREDNADRRLMARGRLLGLVDDETWALFEARLEAIERGLTAVRSHTLIPNADINARLETAGLVPIRRPSTADEVLRRPEASYPLIAEVAGLERFAEDVEEQIEIDIKYAGYVDRAEARAKISEQMDDVVIPEVDWATMTALSTEVRQRLAKHRPTTLGQVKRLPGITPAAVNIVAAWLVRGSPA